MRCMQYFNIPVCIRCIHIVFQRIYIYETLTDNFRICKATSIRRLYIHNRFIKFTLGREREREWERERAKERKRVREPCFNTEKNCTLQNTDAPVRGFFFFFSPLFFRRENTEPHRDRIEFVSKQSDPERWAL